MTLHDIELDERELFEFCHANNVREFLFFGSIVRDDFSEDSDVDVIVDFLGEDCRDLLELGRLQGELCHMFGRQVHLHTPDMIHPYLRTRIRRSARVAYVA